jgi:hypothetical protein
MARNTEVHRGFWWGILRERNHLEDLGIDTKLIMKKSINSTLTGFVWVGRQTNGEGNLVKSVKN